MRQVVRDTAATLAPGAAAVHEEQRSEHEIVLTLEPRAAEASRLAVSHIDAASRSVFVELEEASTVEVWEADKELARPQLMTLLTVATQVGFIERTWRHGGTILKAEVDFTEAAPALGPSTSYFGPERLLASADIVVRRFSSYK